MKRFRVKLVLQDVADAHYFHAGTFEEARAIRATLREEIPAEVRFEVFIYVDTTLGHVRVA